jgi:dihydroorotate dehydrogenase
LYKLLIRPIFFLFSPETIHAISIHLLRIIFFIPGVAYLTKRYYTIQDKRLERNVIGLKFQNPVGLAAGFDKEAEMIDLLAPFGFGAIEIGTLTPKGQPGNDKPRLFRLPKDGALINRMGFNNGGVDAAVKRLRSRKSEVIVGGNIGKNKVTENESATHDYEYAFEALHGEVDYFVVNVSSPNTPNLRELQSKEPLKVLLNNLMERNKAKEIAKPILLKIAPDLTDSQLSDIVEIVKETEISGVIATNTTISREGLKTPQKQVIDIGAGGLSGSPLAERSTAVIKYLREALGSDLCIIGVGGIMSPADAVEKIKAGANLIQIYTGYIYNGPGFVKKINRAILNAGV